MSGTRFSRFLSPLAALLAVLLLASAAGCSSAGEENNPSPSSSATAPTRTGGAALTLPTLEGAETLSIIRPDRGRYRQTADPATVAAVLRRLQEEPRTSSEHARPVLNPDLRLECSSWGGTTLLVTAASLTEESPSGAQRSYQVSGRLLAELSALYDQLGGEEQYYGTTNTVTLPNLTRAGQLSIHLSAAGASVHRTEDPALIEEAVRLIEGALRERLPFFEPANGFSPIRIGNSEWEGELSLSGETLLYQPNGSRESAAYRVAPSLETAIMELYHRMGADS
ncbi:MAG: hypothetical protein HFJ80_04465 [Clostridiales bacterium]|nr:hypothetical protein [Clostridiales bacterium]